MAWKTERWLNELFPGEERIYEEYRALPTRELVIVAAAVLDAALAQLLSKRLRVIAEESQSFLGVNGDGRAPAASFGARIQLALLVGLITPKDGEILRSSKNLRNTFAHRVRASFLAEPVLSQMRKLLDQWRGLQAKLIRGGFLHGTTFSIDKIDAWLGQCSEAREGLVLAVFTTYHAYFHRLESHVRPVDLVRRADA